MRSTIDDLMEEIQDRFSLCPSVRRIKSLVQRKVAMDRLDLCIQSATDRVSILEELLSQLNATTEQQSEWQQVIEQQPRKQQARQQLFAAD